MTVQQGDVAQVVRRTRRIATGTRSTTEVLTESIVKVLAPAVAPPPDVLGEQVGVA